MSDDEYWWWRPKDRVFTREPRLTDYRLSWKCFTSRASSLVYSLCVFGILVFFFNRHDNEISNEYHGHMGTLAGLLQGCILITHLIMTMIFGRPRSMQVYSFMIIIYSTALLIWILARLTYQCTAIREQERKGKRVWTAVTQADIESTRIWLFLYIPFMIWGLLVTRSYYSYIRDHRIWMELTKEEDPLHRARRQAMSNDKDSWWWCPEIHPIAKEPRITDYPLSTKWCSSRASLLLCTIVICGMLVFLLTQSYAELLDGTDKWMGISIGLVLSGILITPLIMAWRTSRPKWSQIFYAMFICYTMAISIWIFAWMKSLCDAEGDYLNAQSEQGDQGVSWKGFDDLGINDYQEFYEETLHAFTKPTRHAEHEVLWQIYYDQECTRICLSIHFLVMFWGWAVVESYCGYLRDRQLWIDQQETKAVGQTMKPKLDSARANEMNELKDSD